MDGNEPRRELRRASRWIIALFWLVQFVELSFVTLIEGKGDALQALVPRLFVLMAGVILSLGFVEIIARLDQRPFRSRLILTVGWALMLCAVLAAINFCAFYYTFREKAGYNPQEYVYTAFAWSWFCLSIAGALLALSYHLESRDRERRLAAMEAVANQAQLAALRYQLNPHFLFNTLNSIASLVAHRDNDVAERMVENLADFLRATLELDPLDDITLAQEIALQRMYLSIEEQRFPDRLIQRFDIPDLLKEARVPPLITQPLIENAIRHAVARSTDPVTVRITASAENGMLTLVVEDDGRPLRAAEKGTGVGIANVGARLAGRFGTAQTWRADALPNGGYRVALRIPLVLPL